MKNFFKLIFNSKTNANRMQTPLLKTRKLYLNSISRKCFSDKIDEALQLENKTAEESKSGEIHQRISINCKD